MRKNKSMNNSQSGSSLIELMIALVVLTVGLIGSMAMVGVAVTGDYRSKSDSTSTALAEMVAEKISAYPVCQAGCTPAPAVSVTDCAGVAHAITVTGVAGGTGATLTATGKIDYTQAIAGVPAGYGMVYKECGITNNIQASYDIRWNINLLPSKDAELVVVGAQLMNARTSTNKGSNAPAVIIRTIIGNDGN